MTSFDDGSGSGAELYATGNFFNAGGSPALRFAKWNGSQWSEVGGGLGSATSMIVFDDGSGGGPALYVGGHFTTAGGVTVNRIARWNGTTWSALGTGLNGPVNSMTIFDDGSGNGSALYVGGTFTQAGGLPALKMARWNGTSWSAITTGINGDVFALAPYDSGTGSQLYAAGSFGVINSINAAYIARWNGTTWSRVGGDSGGGGVNNPVNALSVFNDGAGDAIYAGGSFSSGGPGVSVTMNRIGRWNGTTWEALSTGLGGVVNAITAHDDGSPQGPSLFVGGTFTTAGGNPSKYIAQWPIPCSAPVISQQPQDQAAVFNQPIPLSVLATGTATLTYQWRRNGSDLNDVFQRLEGTHTNQMTIYGWSYNDAGEYDVVITNSLGSATSDAVTVTVPAGGTTNLPVSVTRILHTPEQVPGDPPGSNFTSFSGLAMGSDGTLAFVGSIGGTKTIDLWTAGVLAALYRVGDQAPGVPAGITFAQPNSGIVPFNNWGVAAQGQVFFESDLQGPGVNVSNRRGLWYRDATSTDLVARNGSQAAGAPAGYVYSTVAHNGISDAGAVVFRSEVRNQGVYQSSGVYAWDRTSGTSVIAEAPGAAPGVAGTFLGFGRALVNASGQCAFFAVVDESGQVNKGIWRGGSTPLEMLVHSQYPAPGFSASATIGGLFEVWTVMSDSGEVAFYSAVAESGGVTKHALYRVNNGPIIPVALQGQSAPGADPEQTFFAFVPWALNERSSCLFTSNLAGNCSGSCAQQGLFLATDSGVTPIVLDDMDQLPEAPPGSTLSTIEMAALNNSDQVVVEVTQTIGSARHALYGWTAHDGLFPIAVPGTQIEVSTGVYRTVQDAYLPRVQGGSTGATIYSKLTDEGVIAFNVRFTDDSTGIFEATFLNLLALYAPCASVQEAPEARAIMAGESATFSVLASGADPITYQWAKDGVNVSDGGNITGATTNLLTVSPATLSDAGEYTVAVSNACGFETSDVATLEIVPGTPYCFGDGEDPVVDVDCPCLNFGSAGHGCANSFSSLGALLAASGTTSPNTILLTATKVPNNNLTVGFRNTANASPGGAVFGDGIRCQSGTLIRFGAHNSGSGGDIANTWSSPTATVGSGLTRYYQVQYRNPAPTFCPPATFNITNGYQITW